MKTVYYHGVKFAVLTDSKGRELADVEIDAESWSPEFMLVSANYDDTGELVPSEELDKISQEDLSYYYWNELK